MRTRAPGGRAEAEGRFPPGSTDLTSQVGGVLAGTDTISPDAERGVTYEIYFACGSHSDEVTSTTVTIATGGGSGRTLSCGTGWNGLSVVAVTTRGGTACSTARQVSTAFGKAMAAKKRRPITLFVNTSAWTCQERQGHPNPYQECVSRKVPSEKVQLVS